MVLTAWCDYHDNSCIISSISANDKWFPVSPLVHRIKVIVDCVYLEYDSELKQTTITLINYIDHGFHENIESYLISNMLDLVEKIHIHTTS